MARATAPYELRPSPALTHASAARTAGLSVTGWVSSETCESKAINWTLPGARSTTPAAPDFASSMRLPDLHAERAVDGDDASAACERSWRARAADEEVREGQRDAARCSRDAHGEQQQVLQPPVLDRALRALLEEHQRAERQRRRLVLPQQVHLDGHGDGGETGEKPGGEEAHHILPCRITRYSRKPSSSGRLVSSSM